MVVFHQAAFDGLHKLSELLSGFLVHWKEKHLWSERLVVVGAPMTVTTFLRLGIITILHNLDDLIRASTNSESETKP